MKTQLSKPSRTKARYTEEYKQQALELWRKSGSRNGRPVSVSARAMQDSVGLALLHFLQQLTSF
jgi:hypothetical protein